MTAGRLTEGVLECVVDRGDPQLIGARHIDEHGLIGAQVGGDIREMLCFGDTALPFLVSVRSLDTDEHAAADDREIDPDCEPILRADVNQYAAHEHSVSGC